MTDKPTIAAEEQTTTILETPSVEMDLDSNAVAVKRAREDDDELKETEEAKKAKLDKSVEEERFEEEGEGKVAASSPVNVGYKKFESSVEMFDYFFKFLHFWPPNLNVNKYEHAMLLDLLKKGHLEADKKIGAGINTFQVRYHSQWKSRCFFLVREDNSADDFSFRKCVDHILPLPENMVVKSDVNKVLGGGGRGGRGGGRGNWRGRGRGGK